MIECVLQEQIIGDGANGIVGCALRSSRFAVACGIDIVAAAGQAPSRRTTVMSSWIRFERHHDRLSACGLDRGDVLRQRALVVVGLVAGGLGNGDARGHGTSVKAAWFLLIFVAG